MSIAFSRINIAATLIKEYTGTNPLPVYLKNYFAQHKKFGSKDRKHISHLVFAYYRLGNSIAGWQIIDALHLAIFLTNNTPNIWSALFEEDQLNNWPLSIAERLKLAISKYPFFEIKKLFPLANYIGNLTNQQIFIESHLHQPNIFIRIRPGNYEVVINKLNAAGIDYTLINDTCVMCLPDQKLQDIFWLNGEIVIQDRSSQRIGELLNVIKSTSNSPIISIWDACAASGGKSILATDMLPNVKILATDIRPQILKNLQLRFLDANITNYSTKVFDASNVQLKLNEGPFDLVIADVPCSGSGTWSRSPENLVSFNEEVLNNYQYLQQKIINTTVRKVKKGGYYLYITCSVFKAENEDQLTFISKEFPHLKLLHQQYFEGFQVKADTLYAALFTFE